MMMKDGSAHHVHKTGELSGCSLGLASVRMTESKMFIQLFYQHSTFNLWTLFCRRNIVTFDILCTIFQYYSFMCTEVFSSCFLASFTQ